MKFHPSLHPFSLPGMILAPVAVAGSALVLGSMALAGPQSNPKRPAAKTPARGASRPAAPPKAAVPLPTGLPLLGVDLAPDPFTPSVKVSLRNRGAQPVTSRIALSNPDNFLGAARSVQTVTVPPGQETQARFALPGAAMAPDSRYAFTADVETPSAKITASRLLSFFRIERAWKAPALDGTMENWLNSSMIIVNVPGRPAGGTGWKGRADMTATARFLWDSNHLYVMSRRTDDVVHLAPSPTDPNGDRVRIALSPTGSHFPDAPWVTVDLVPQATGVAAVRNAAPSLKLAPGVIPGVQASATEQNGVSVLVAAIPWKDLGITQGAKTKRLGLTFRALDDDGQGSKSWLEWGGGASTPADPVAFSDVSLGD
ncbi:MAG: hypothetical protein KY468_19370 [Armatimonadetes bacterium]|nr:hypothetical protein [Armatimonadota bacterium]